MTTKPVVLLAVDGSPQSMLAVVYISQLIDPKRVAVDLFHVKADAPEAIYDLVGDEGISHYAQEIGQWAALASTSIGRFMEQSKEVFLEAGFPAADVTIAIQPRKIGIARDILNRCESGYAAVVFGRQGYGALGEYMLGSVAAKLVEAVSHVPVVIVGGGTDNKKVMVAFDSSKQIQHGLEQVSRLVIKDLDEILLCHIVRPLALPSSAVRYSFKAGYDSHWLDANTQKIIPDMVAAKKRLSHTGFDLDIFKTAILKEKSSRAKGLSEEADARGFGTIIIGRRGLTVVKEFTMGRVPRKLLHLTLHQAVWIV